LHACIVSGDVATKLHVAVDDVAVVEGGAMIPVAWPTVDMEQAHPRAKQRGQPASPGANAAGLSAFLLPSAEQPIKAESDGQCHLN
jgi:hypothetical protein